MECIVRGVAKESDMTERLSLSLSRASCSVLQPEVQVHLMEAGVFALATVSWMALASRFTYVT